MGGEGWGVRLRSRINRVEWVRGREVKEIGGSEYRCCGCGRGEV